MSTRNTEDQNEYGIYTFEISLTLKRATDRYSTTTLVKFSTNQEKPLADDGAARRELVSMVADATDTAADIVNTRIDFDNRVKQLTSGSDDVVEVA